MKTETDRISPCGCTYPDKVSTGAENTGMCACGTECNCAPECACASAEACSRSCSCAN